MISVACPKCSEPFDVPDSLAGQTESCPACGNVSLIPRVVARATPAPATAAPYESDDAGSLWTALVTVGLTLAGVSIIIVGFVFTSEIPDGSELRLLYIASILVAIGFGFSLIGLATLIHHIANIADCAARGGGAAN